MDRRPSKGNSEENTKDEWSCYANILALKKFGFSIDEIRHLTMQEFIIYTDLVFGQGDEKQATQKDIDAFLS